MKSTIFRALAVVMAAFVIFSTTSFCIPKQTHAQNIVVETPQVIVESEEVTKSIDDFPMKSPTFEFVNLSEEPVIQVEPVIETPLEDWEIILLAKLTEAESGGEPEEGQRLVIDTVLNRMDHWAFPDTIYDVIYQPYHFSPCWNGGIDCYTGREDIIELIKEEMIQRTNYDVIYFCAGGYSQYGDPLFQVGNHYFSSYD